MKRFLTVFVVMIALVGIVAINVQAQEVSGITGKGIKVGLNLANFTGEDADPPAGVDKKMRMGLAVGGFITYSFNEILAVQPEVLFSMKGAKYEADGSTSTTKLSYIEIPVLAKLMLATQSNMKPNFFIGPSLGILMSAKAEDVDIKDDVKSTDFGFVMGAGVNMNMVSGSAITFDARYTMGLTSLDNTDADAKIKNGVISVFAGYSF